MYHRKTTTDAELSEARRRAALSRKNRRGGRPAGWRKNPNALPPRTVAIDPLDLGVFRNYAQQVQKKTLKGAMHILAAALVFGVKGIPCRKELAPEGWVVFQRMRNPLCEG